MPHLDDDAYRGSLFKVAARASHAARSTLAAAAPSAATDNCVVFASIQIQPQVGWRCDTRGAAILAVARLRRRHLRVTFCLSFVDRANPAPPWDREGGGPVSAAVHGRSRLPRCHPRCRRELCLWRVIKTPLPNGALFAVCFMAPVPSLHLQASRTGVSPPYAFFFSFTFSFFLLPCARESFFIYFWISD